MLAQLRLAATRHACFEPFVAWWTLVRRAQRDKQRAGKEEAEHAQRRRRLATDRHEEQAARVARLDRSLRRFGARSQLAARFGRWRQAAVFQMLAPAVWSWQARRWLRRLRRAADARRLYVARPTALAARRACKRALRRCAQAALFGAWRGARRRRHGLRGAWARWGARSRATRWAAALLAAAERQRVSRPLEAALLCWWRASRRRAWAARRQAAAQLERCEQALWARAARRSLRALAAADDAPETAAALAALGGEWRGGRAALQTASEELAQMHATILRQRATAAQAATNAESVAARAESLLNALVQQQHAVDAQRRKLERSEAEAICLVKERARAVAQRRRLERHGGRAAGAAPEALPIVQALAQAEKAMADRLRLADRRSYELGERLSRLQRRVKRYTEARSLAGAA